LDPLYIARTAKATNFKFVVQFAFIQLKVTWQFYCLHDTLILDQNDTKIMKIG